ncbi:YcnI family protein [uncultured Ramlibacter sp.]|uniref:YcnI family copper-binding membrane protein n=1 Tax=uncultured Ramlibacter sp. TaxID=260755 RepID=UPI002609013A|nr:YcnI family protein [uncultured Ramlibacter sp.]
MQQLTIKLRAIQVLLTGAAALFGNAQAHVVLDYQVAPAGSSYKASFKVGHGCGASATRQFTVEIPAGVRGARPMPKPGWTLELQREKLAQPYLSHGREVAEDVVRITWTARTADYALASAHYDEFVLVATVPQQPGPLYWPVRQVCEQGRIDWVEQPQPGQKLSDLKSPAALLEILPGTGAGAHQH